MIIVYVSVKTKQNESGKFERIINEIQDGIRQMPGCIKNEWYSEPNKPQRYVIYGEFDTRAHFESYLNSPFVKRIGDELIPLLEVPPEFKHYEATILDSHQS